jgi:cell fate (sporulation/competence/biofilm development) regulator YlbF (YheA/YmcA/DUF963 family)
MRYFELCEKSANFANEIMSSSEFKELLEIKEKISKSIPQLVDEFRIAKEKYEEVSKYSIYHPDLEKVRARLVRAKEALYTNSLVIRYKELEKEIQKKLNLVAQEIAEVISANIK